MGTCTCLKLSSCIYVLCLLVVQNKRSHSDIFIVCVMYIDPTSTFYCPVVSSLLNSELASAVPAVNTRWFANPSCCSLCTHTGSLFSWSLLGLADSACIVFTFMQISDHMYSGSTHFHPHHLLPLYLIQEGNLFPPFLVSGTPLLWFLSWWN